MIALLATLAIQALVTMAVLAPPVFVAVAAPDIGVDANQIGVFTSITYGAACLAAAWSGAPVRRYGAIRMSQIGLLCCGLGMALIATGSLPVVVLGGVLLGIGYGPITPASSHILIRQTPPHRRGLIFSIKQTGVPLGGALAGAVVPPLVLALGWRGATLAVAAATVVLALAAQPLRAMFDADADPKARAERGILEGPCLVLGEPGLRRLALGSLAFSALQLCFGAFIVTFLTGRAGIDFVSAGLVLTAAQVAGMLGRVLWGWVADRALPPRPLLCLLGLGMAGAAAALAFVSAAWPLALVAIVAMGLGALALGWNGVFLAEVARVAPAGTASVATGGGAGTHLSRRRRWAAALQRGDRVDQQLSHCLSGCGGLCRLGRPGDRPTRRVGRPPMRTAVRSTRPRVHAAPPPPSCGQAGPGQALRGRNGAGR